MWKQQYMGSILSFGRIQDYTSKQVIEYSPSFYPRENIGYQGSCLLINKSILPHFISSPLPEI